MQAKCKAKATPNGTHPTPEKKDIENRSQFEALLLQLSAEFINLPFDRIDEKIDDVLKLIVESLDIDRSLLHEFSEDKQTMLLSHFYVRPGVKIPTSKITSEDQPYLTKNMLENRITAVERIEDLPRTAIHERKYLKQQGVKSAIAIPLVMGKNSVGALTFTTVYRKRSWPEDLVQRLELVSEIFANALDRKQREQSLQNALSEINHLKDRLQQENIYLQEEINLEYQHEEIVGRSHSIQKVLSLAEQVAKVDSTVLILGETGTGKELVARAIHRTGLRKDRPMVKVNCAALPATLIESELFGREKGAYTGALSRQMGRFELADRSTIFLDEIGELPMHLQTKLLRFLQEGQFERLGSSKTMTVDVRVIAATNRDIEKAIQEGAFREDLYYRLNVYPIEIQPLREHPEDIPDLLWAFVQEYGEKMGKKIDKIPAGKIKDLQHHNWPGNVRELRNMVERAMIISTGSSLNIELPKQITSTYSKIESLDEVQRNHIIKVLEMTDWKVSGRQGAAELLGINPKTLESRMRRLGIHRRALFS